MGYVFGLGFCCFGLVGFCFGLFGFRVLFCLGLGVLFCLGLGVVLGVVSGHVRVWDVGALGSCDVNFNYTLHPKP